MDLKNIRAVLAYEPEYRYQQINKLIYQDFIDNWERGLTLPKILREKLAKEYPLEIPSKLFISKDQKTIKALIFLKDNLQIEAVLMRFEDRNTVCVSSQVGCPLGCVFCATGKMGFKRNLTKEEIIEQVLLFSRYLKTKGQKITNIVFMGMGEPFLNYDNVMLAIKFFNNPEKFNIGARRISISTAGIIPKINKFSQEPLEINLAISLHASNDSLRSSLMPINRSFSLDKLMREVRFYVEKKRRKVMFEYILINAVNDSEKHARELSKLLNHPLYHLNLIPYNQTGELEPATEESTERFKKILKTNRIPFTQRYRLGEDINAACGQLALKKSV